MTGENERDEKGPAPAEKPLTRGERIRQQREAKAKAKIEKRGRESEVIEDRAIEVAEQAREATQEIVRESGGKIALVLVGVLVLLVGVAVVRDMMAGAREEKARALADADSAETPAERATELAEVARANEDEERLFVWARLGEADALLEKGDAEGARAIYDALSGRDALGDLERRLALEGLAAANVAKGDAEAARAAFERLAESEDPSHKNTAELGIARILASEGKRAEAKALVEGVVARLKEAGREGRGYTYEEAETLAASLEGG